jgi:hypothetical protein
MPVSNVLYLANDLSYFLCSFLSLWLYSPLDLGHFFSFLFLYTVGRTPWRGISSSQCRYLHTEQHQHRINAHRHHCLEWDSNPRSQCSSGHCARRLIVYCREFFITIPKWGGGCGKIILHLIVSRIRVQWQTSVKTAWELLEQQSDCKLLKCEWAPVCWIR